MKYDSWANRPAMEAETITRLTAGRFAADRAIHEYARNIWGAEPVK